MTSANRTGGELQLSIVARAMRGAITGYQRATDHRPSPCRYVPSCSYYAVEAVEVHGAAKGAWLSLRRLLRCRPGAPSGWDPVPDSSGRLAPDPTLCVQDVGTGSEAPQMTAGEVVTGV